MIILIFKFIEICFLLVFFVVVFEDVIYKKFLKWLWVEEMIFFEY